MDSREEIIRSLEISKQLAKRNVLESLYNFNTKCLDVQEGGDRVKLGKFHKELCDFVDWNPTRQKLILVPRGHLKSTLITIGKTLQWINEDPSVRILIANATYQMAVTFLRVIKNHLKGNAMLHDLFGDLSADATSWSENAITLKSAKSVGGEKEATVFCYGMGGNLVSQHYDKIILDDIVNQDSVNTRDQIEKTIQFYRQCQPLLEKNGEFIIIGTRWHEEDLYGWIMSEESNVRGEFEIFLREAIKNEVWDGDKKRFVQGQVLWPEKYSLRDLSQIRRKMGPYEFSAQYQNNPFPPDTADFKREWFKYYEPADLKGSELNIYTLIDPAISLEKTADYTGIITLGTDKFKNVYILDIIRDRFKVNELINTIFHQYERWHPLSIGIEDVAFQAALRYAIQQEQQDRKRYLPIIELKPRTRSKDQRIKGLQPLYANGKVYHNKSLLFNNYLEDELLRFPRGKNDDLIDAFAYSLDLMHPPDVKLRERVRQKYLY